MIHRILYMLLFALFLTLPVVARGQYMLVGGESESDAVNVFDMDAEGRLSFRTSWHRGDNEPLSNSTDQIVFSPSGRWCVIRASRCCLLYSVDEALQFHFVASVKESDSHFASSFFLPDESRLFLSKGHFIAPGNTRYSVEIHGPDGAGGWIRLADPEVPSTATLQDQCAATSRGELIGSGDILGQSVAICQYDRASETITPRQRLRYTPFYYSALNGDEDRLIGTYRSDAMCLARADDGTWSKVWSQHFSPNGYITSHGVYFLPGGRQALLMLSYEFLDDGVSGPTVYDMDEQGVLAPGAMSELRQLGASALTADARFFAALYTVQTQQTSWYLGVWRRTESGHWVQTGYLPLNGHHMGAFAFHPKAHPTAAGAVWAAYE